MLLKVRVGREEESRALEAQSAKHPREAKFGQLYFRLPLTSLPLTSLAAYRFAQDKDATAASPDHCCDTHKQQQYVPQRQPQQRTEKDEPRRSVRVGCRLDSLDFKRGLYDTQVGLGYLDAL